MNTQQTEMSKRDLTAQDERNAKRAFVEPVISGPVDVLEATAFFQVFSVGSDPGIGID